MAARQGAEPDLLKCLNSEKLTEEKRGKQYAMQVSRKFVYFEYCKK